MYFYSSRGTGSNVTDINFVRAVRHIHPVPGNGFRQLKHGRSTLRVNVSGKPGKTVDSFCKHIPKY